MTTMTQEDDMPIIEKNIPMPGTHGKHYGGPGNQKYPEFRKMEVGDSVFYAGEKSTGQASASARKYASRSGKRFHTYALDGGVRIWRVE